MVWRNGYIPESDLIIFNRGRNDIDGDWYWGLTPATYARHLALVKRAKDRAGRTLEPGDGWSTVRPYDAQVIARRRYGIGAAWPGTSSHGGFWEGQETLAIDYSNWSWVYGGDRSAFYEDCRAVGLAPGMIEPRRGYPDEPWHVIDLNPRVGPGPAATDATPFQEDDMYDENAEKRLMDVNAKLMAKLEDIVAAIAGEVIPGTTDMRPLARLVAKSDQGRLLEDDKRSLDIITALNGQPIPGTNEKRAIAKFLSGQGIAPADVDEDAIVRGVLAGLAQDRDALIAAIRALPQETIAALKSAL